MTDCGTSWERVRSSSRPLCNRSAALLADSCAKRSKYRVSHAKMKVLDDLHVIGGNNQAQIAEISHVAALKSGQTDRYSSNLPCDLQRLEHVGRPATAADRECNIG